MCDVLPSLNGLKLLESTVPEVPCFQDAEIEELNFHRYI